MSLIEIIREGFKSVEDFKKEKMAQIPIDENKWREIQTQYKIKESVDINGFKKFSMDYGGAVLESSTLEGLKGLVLGAAKTKPRPPPAVQHTGASGSYDSSIADKEQRLAEIMRTRTMPPAWWLARTAGLWNST